MAAPITHTFALTTSWQRLLAQLRHIHDELGTSPQRPMNSSKKFKERMRRVVGQSVEEQGWERCQAGFRGVDFKAEERTARGHQQTRKRSKIVRLEPSSADNEQGSLAIDWSSSSDSPSDTELLSRQETPHNAPRYSTKRKKSCWSSRREISRQAVRGIGSFHRDDADLADEEEKLGGVGEGSGLRKPSSAAKKLESFPGDKKMQMDISDYNSPSEDLVSMTSSSQQASSSLHISDQSPTPQPSSDASPSQESPLTGTELLKKLKLPARTPDKEDTAGGPSGGGDSAKKKKRRFIRGGLAEGLQRVINRERSSTAFWAHRTADTTTLQSLTLDLSVLSVEEARGLFVTRCQRCTLTSDNAVTEEIFVLFTQANGRQLKLAVGSKVRVHPPWQKVTLPYYKEPVILCTYFCHSLDGSDEANVATRCSVQNKTDTTSSSTKLKPVQLFNRVQQKSESTLHSTPPDTTEAPSSHVSDSFLDSIAQSGGYTTAGMRVRARIHRVLCRDSSAEPISLNRKHQGSLKRSQVPPARAVQWTLLLQDNRGIFCELHVTLRSAGDEEEELWRRSLIGGEGRTLVFSGLKVMRRVNRTRSPGLFSLIDSVWSPCEHPVSQSEEESQSQGLGSPQSFCYILGVQTLTNTPGEDVSDRVGIPYRERVIHTLRELQQLSDASSQRVSFYAKVIHAHPETDAHDMMSSQQQLPASCNSVWHLFVTDHSLNAKPTEQEDYELGTVTGMATRGDSTGAGCSGWSQGIRPVHVHVRSSCYVSESVEECLTIPGSLVLLRDVCLDQRCFLYADVYTTIRRVTRRSSNSSDVDMMDTVTPKDDITDLLSHALIPPIPALDLHSDENTMVSVTGVVTGIDETTAYSWPACDTCGNNRLEAKTSSGSQLHCGTCQRSVTSPLTRMHLELLLHCATLDIRESIVKVQLLQSSIEQVLPPLSSLEEGYDLQCIMGVHIGPISCFLRFQVMKPRLASLKKLEEKKTMRRS